MRSSQEEKRKRRLYKHTIKTKDYRVERIQPQVQAQVQCSASLALSTTSTPQQTSCSDCIHVSSQARAPHKACRIAYRQIMDAWFAITIKQRVPADKRSRHAICQTHPSGPFFSFSSFLVLPIWAGATVGPTNCRKIQSPNVILVYVWLFRERACFNVRVDGDGFNLGSSLASTLVRGQTDNSCARGESERTHAHCYCNA